MISFFCPTLRVLLSFCGVPAPQATFTHNLAAMPSALSRPTGSLRQRWTISKRHPIEFNHPGYLFKWLELVIPLIER